MPVLLGYITLWGRVNWGGGVIAERCDGNRHSRRDARELLKGCLERHVSALVWEITGFISLKCSKEE